MQNATSHRPGAFLSQTPKAGRLARIEWDRVIGALAAAVLLLVAVELPLWKMTLLAPQYPGGLEMTAYGDRFDGAVREINILNHYIGMRPIDDAEVAEMDIFRPAIYATVAALLILALLPLPHWLKVIESVAIWLLPLGFLADLQWWLYRYGHSMDPLAPLRMPGFTPKVIGETTVMNFRNVASVEVGFWLIVAAAVAVSLLPSLLRALWELPRSITGTAAAGLVLLAAAVAAPSPAAAQQPPARIADLIAAAEPGGTVFVPPGVYREQLVIEKPVLLRGGSRATIDGGGTGDVIVVKADNVEISGFTIRNSGRAISQEPAAIRLLGHGAVISNNRIEDVYFGLHLQGGGHHEIGYNVIRPDAAVAPEWRGHAISLWNSDGNVIRRNQIGHAKEGIFLSYSNGNFVHGNTVTDSRFGIHYMNAENNRFTENIFRDNLAGGLVMQSKGILLRGNEFSNHRHGSTAIGLLLKTVDDIWAEDNRITGNTTGITVEETPSSPKGSAVFYRNLIALNRTGLALTTTTAATFYENSFVDNALQVSGRGGALMGALPGHGAAVATPAAGAHAGHGSHAGPPAPTPATPADRAVARNRWTADGRGNYWSDYTGFDRDGDGVGDLSYRARSAFEDLRDRHPALELFRHTPAHQAIDAAGRLAPIVRPEVLIEDQAPLLSAPTPLPRAENSRELLTVSAVLLLAALAPLLPRLVRRPFGLPARPTPRRGTS
jgi:nitrous oxidase accessory protein